MKLGLAALLIAALLAVGESSKPKLNIYGSIRRQEPLIEEMNPQHPLPKMLLENAIKYVQDNKNEPKSQLAKLLPMGQIMEVKVLKTMEPGEPHYIITYLVPKNEACTIHFSANAKAAIVSRPRFWCGPQIPPLRVPY